MLIAPYPVNEEARLEFLRSLDVLDTATEETFDRFTRVLAELLQVPTALISLVEADKQWFKSKVGLDTCETSRDIAFCAMPCMQRALWSSRTRPQMSGFTTTLLLSERPLFDFTPASLFAPAKAM
ncbi:hypothetical protein L6218_18895 [Pseudomonas syringae pv. syringae]|uniref:hypothetical protein n=1 Tax=Pseudomonas TaxID=286 RepID=UPI000D455943|nr:hypothetical protein [Pseudomonas syringae]MCH5499892.1 hypothetical protein [Pseudomonas syringae pv. syringae]MCH5526022.1 hypothetical protein [Pseudomonas syringae pv. syringae]MCH5561514.1 hypothetical protein [Pseudomonas syringae pv. syringae]MCH5566569.1 hypothetical protein [Pseudomonas syringae pv. syringae]MCH5594921.1 hypothetical protein [Pseudomonas syringae pv. syringae]